MKAGDRARVVTGSRRCLPPSRILGELGTIIGPVTVVDGPSLGEVLWVHLDVGGTWALCENELELVEEPLIELLRRRVQRRVPVRWLVGYWVMAIVSCLTGIITLWLTLDLVIALGASLFVWAVYGCYQLYPGIRGKYRGWVERRQR